MTKSFSLIAALLLSLPLAAQAETPAEQFMSTWDRDGNGIATLAELEAMRGDVFASFDANEDGMLDLEEHAIFDEARANDVAGYEGKQREQMQKMADGMRMEATDANGDRLVSLDEFQASTVKWFTQLDKNGDGGITLDDFAMKPAQ
ncbi:hypothetical protein BMG00_01510 [Thioclava marina]|uniref:EF-hand domain-containing protein n=1 Tax=Thioclava marina TaxID=1915077 RepID=A0ABX3MQP8_9RHOB|nr:MULTISPECIES: EF-hand domain-containing protein [Thioclava]OOY12559.1 hypothetical protein BMG00_01510 [Thioclava marina]OOY28578.1 hypothetical protein BMI90_07905 [Thioclava sp. L04-15]